MFPNAASILKPLVLVVLSICLLLSGCGGGGNSNSTNSQKTLTQVSISPQTLSVAKGASHQMAVMATFSDGSQQNVTASASWSSNPSGAVSVSGAGQLTGMTQGTAQVSAQYQGMTGKASITVTAAALVSIAVSPNQSIVPLGASEQLSVTGTFTDGSTSDVTSSVTWSATPAADVSVSTAGMLKGLATGSVQVSAQYQSMTGNASVTVTKAALSSITISPNPSSIPVGLSEQLSAMGNFTDGSTMDLTQMATWSAAPSSSASLSVTGMLKAVAQGSVQVSAVFQSVTGNAAVTVTPPALVSIAVTPNLSDVPIGRTEQLAATGTYTDGSTADITALASWNTNPSVFATISSAGIVSGVAVGNVQVSASYQGKVGQAAVTVPNLIFITVSPNPSSLPKGTTEQLTATGLYSDGSKFDLTQLAQWGTSPANTAAINSTGNLTGTAIGTAQITAQYQKVTGNASVTVAPPIVVSIAVTPGWSAVAIGGNEQLTATGTFSDGSTQDLTASAQWNSVDATVAGVGVHGSTLGNSRGTAIITASQGGVIGGAAVMVLPGPIASLEVIPNVASIGMDGSQQFLAIAHFKNGLTEDVTAGAAWSSLPSNVVSLSSGGIAGALRPGSTTVTASAAGASGSAAITVLPEIVVNYFDLHNAQIAGADGTIRVTNPGVTGTDLCAMFYVYDQNQELSECCGCTVTQNGLRTLSLVSDFNSNPLTGAAPPNGVIQMVPSDPSVNPQCNPASLAPKGVVLGWGSNVQVLNNSTFQFTESRFNPAPLTPAEQQELVSQCAFLQQLGSGQGICSCGTGD